jgi:Na+/proline symporter
MAYPAMLTFLPAGFLGLMIAGMLAAYVSTLSTHLNWGTSYLVHDFYRRFVKPEATEKHYVLVARLMTAVLMLFAAMLTYVLDSASRGFTLLLSIGAGTGLLYLLRWYWWRVNAWAEVAAMCGSFLTAVAFEIVRQTGTPIPDHISLLWTVAVTSVIWIAAAFLGTKTDEATLVSFYKLVRPAGPGWKHVQAKAGVGPSPDSLPQAMLGWMLGIAFVYSALFGSGSFLYGNTNQGIVFTVVFVLSGYGVVKVLQGFWKNTPDHDK